MNDKKALTLSIVIPVYNEEIYLDACLKAIGVQTVAPDEVVVVDNNSTDRSMEIAKSFDFVKVVREKHQGIFHARNKGFDSAVSDIIGRIDADTVLPADWVESVKEFYQQKDSLRHAYTGGCYFYNIRLPKLIGWLQGQIAFRMNRLLLGHYITFGSNMALPKKMWKATKQDMCDRTDIHEDLDVSIHLHRAGYHITYNESLKVGIAMKRVLSHRKDLWKNLMLWPQTLKVHGKWTWIIGYLGAVFMYICSPIGPALEWCAIKLGLKPLG